MLLLGGEPTVKRTVRGLADPPWCCTLGPAGAVGVHALTFHLEAALQQKMLMMSRRNTCVHRSLCVQAVGAALISLSTQSDSDWLLRQTTRADGSASTTTDSINGGQSNTDIKLATFRQQGVSMTLGHTCQRSCCLQGQLGVRCDMGCSGGRRHPAHLLKSWWAWGCQPAPSSYRTPVFWGS